MPFPSLSNFLKASTTSCPCDIPGQLRNLRRTNTDEIPLARAKHTGCDEKGTKNQRTWRHVQCIWEHQRTDPVPNPSLFFGVEHSARPRDFSCSRSRSLTVASCADGGSTRSTPILDELAQKSWNCELRTGESVGGGNPMAKRTFHSQTLKVWHI